VLIWRSNGMSLQNKRGPDFVIAWSQLTGEHVRCKNKRAVADCFQIGKIKKWLISGGSLLQPGKDSVWLLTP